MTAFLILSATATVAFLAYGWTRVLDWFNPPDPPSDQERWEWLVAEARLERLERARRIRQRVRGLERPSVYDWAQDD